MEAAVWPQLTELQLPMRPATTTTPSLSCRLHKYANYQASRRIKRSDHRQEKPLLKKPTRWEKRTRVEFRTEADFQRALHVYTAVRRLPSLRWHASRLVCYDSTARTITVDAVANLKEPLVDRAIDHNFDAETLQSLKQELCGYVALLYDNGVAFCVERETVLLMRGRGVSWVMYLSALATLGYCSKAGRGSAEWAERKRVELGKVQDMFAPLERYAAYRDAAATSRNNLEAGHGPRD